MLDTEEEVSIRPLGQPGDLGWMVMAHGEVYAAEFGWDTSFEAFVSRIIADYAASHDPLREAGWVAQMNGRRVGCILCVADPERAGTAKLRTLLVHPAGRGRGLGAHLVDCSLRFASSAGYERVRLWTQDTLKAARSIYLKRGFKLVEEQPHHSFGVDLVGEVYEIDLRPDRRHGSHNG
jgi:GNAT superfamily N-acetyltransferase